MGSLYWQLNDVWPVSSWSTVDYYGSYKAAHYTAKKCHQLVYTTMVFRNNSYLIYIINDNIKTLSGIFKYTIFDFEGKVIKP
jgi:beta-mannosidase